MEPIQPRSSQSDPGDGSFPEREIVAPDRIPEDVMLSLAQDIAMLMYSLPDIDLTENYSFGDRIQVWTIDRTALSDYGLDAVDSAYWMEGRWHVQIITASGPVGFARVMVPTSDPDDAVICEIGLGEFAARIPEAIKRYEIVADTTDKAPILIEDPAHNAIILGYTGDEERFVVLDGDAELVDRTELDRRIKLPAIKGLI